MERYITHQVITKLTQVPACPSLHSYSRFKRLEVPEILPPLSSTPTAILLTDGARLRRTY
jgi:hypothetical protein